jgi:hypothetical protein
MDNQELVRILRGLPECRLRLIELIAQVTKDDGSIDPEKVLFHAKELEECRQEANAYISATRKAVQCLMKLVRSHG